MTARGSRGRVPRQGPRWRAQVSGGTGTGTGAGTGAAARGDAGDPPLTRPRPARPLRSTEVRPGAGVQVPVRTVPYRCSADPVGPCRSGPTLPRCPPRPAAPVPPRSGPHAQPCPVSALCSILRGSPGALSPFPGSLPARQFPARSPGPPHSGSVPGLRGRVTPPHLSVPPCPHPPPIPGTAGLPSPRDGTWHWAAPGSFPGRR